MHVKIPYWIQHADFSSQDYDPVDLAQANQVLLTHDWKTELRLGTTLEETQQALCPPGIGFMGDDGSILHICPLENEQAFFHYHYKLDFVHLRKQNRRT